MDWMQFDVGIVIHLVSLLVILLLGFLTQ